MFTMGPNLIALTVMLTDKPETAKNSNVRLEHTHFFSQDFNEGGHYHCDVTPDEIEYVAYIVPNN